MLRTALHISLTALIICSIVACSSEEHETYPRKVSIAYLWSITTERSTTIKEDLYIEGYVVANDKLGELHKSIVIADDTGGVELKIDAENINSQIPLFCRVTLRCSGLSIGREGGKTVIGSAPTSDYVVDRLAPTTLHSYIKICDDNDTAPQGEELRISELDAYKMLRYVTIRNLHIVEEEAGKKWCEPDTTAPDSYQTTTRHFYCENDTLRIVVDSRCSYSWTKMPQRNCTMHGIVDWHDGDIALRISAHQVTEDSSTF